MSEKQGFDNAAMQSGGDYPSQGQEGSYPPAYSAQQYSQPGGANYSQPGAYSGPQPGANYSQSGGAYSSQPSAYSPQPSAYSPQPGTYSNPAQLPKAGYGQPPVQSAYPVTNTGHMAPGAYYGQNTVVTTVPGSVVATGVIRENTPQPDTACGLFMSIVVLIVCAWPCGIGAIVANRRAKALVDLGQHTAARAQLRTMYIWIAVSVVFGIIAWVVIGLRIKAIIDASKETHTVTYYYG